MSSDAPSVAGAPSSRSEVAASPYAAINKFRVSQHLDGSAVIGTRIQANRHFFEDFVAELAVKLQANGVPDCPEIDLALQLIEQAKDAVGRALIHAVGTHKGKPFAEAVAEKLIRA